jgi:hypothetical protein
MSEMLKSIGIYFTSIMETDFSKTATTWIRNGIAIFPLVGKVSFLRLAVELETPSFH